MADPQRVGERAAVPAVVLVRHGETDDNVAPLRFQGRSDTPLNGHGVAQAARLAEQVRGMGFEALWTSDLSRARETAGAIAAATGLEPIVDPRLAEGDRGRWEGLLMDEVAAAEPALHAAWLSPGDDFRFPGGESLLEHQARAGEAIASIRKTMRKSLVVCHGGTIRLLLCLREGLGLDAFHGWDVPNCALVEL